MKNVLKSDCKFPKTPFDAVITDCLMDFMDGHELGLLIRSKDEKKRPLGRTLIVCVSAMANIDSQVFDACLLKPTTIDGLKMSLAPILR